MAAPDRKVTARIICAWWAIPGYYLSGAFLKGSNRVAAKKIRVQAKR
jgi:hypothetical protein